MDEMQEKRPLSEVMEELLCNDDGVAATEDDVEEILNHREPCCMCGVMTSIGVGAGDSENPIIEYYCTDCLIDLLEQKFDKTMEELAAGNPSMKEVLKDYDLPHGSFFIVYTTLFDIILSKVENESTSFSDYVLTLRSVIGPEQIFSSHFTTGRNMFTTAFRIMKERLKKMAPGNARAHVKPDYFKDYYNQILANETDK